MITLHPEPAPSTPLNLRLDVVYAPRAATPPWVGYMAVEHADGTSAILAYAPDGTGAELFRGPMFGAYLRLAIHLGMA